MLYHPVPRDESLSQGDLIDDCPLARGELKGETIDLDAEPAIWKARIIVLTQACDLAQDKTTKVLVATVQPVRELIDGGVLKPAAIRDQIRRGLSYGWYFLPTAPAPIPLVESIIDLHEIHTVPRPFLEHLIANGKRICRLITPYREHLAQHFAVTYMRIGLPAPYDTEP